MSKSPWLLRGSLSHVFPDGNEGNSHLFPDTYAARKVSICHNTTVGSIANRSLYVLED